jgi:hypothetical protein
MILAWIGLAFLSASWLFAIGYYTQPDLTLSWLVEHFGGTYGNWPDPPLWPFLVGVGALCLASVKPCRLGITRSLVSVLLCVPGLLLLPWPYRAGPLLVTCGLVFSCAAELLPSAGRTAAGVSWFVRWTGGALGRIAAALLLAGVALLAQAVVLEWYQAQTAYSHELPWPLRQLIGGVGRCLGIDLAVSDTTMPMHSMRRIHLLGATWELLLDPATLCLFIGGLVLLAWRSWTDGSGGIRFVRWLGRSLALAAVVALWLPVRSGLYMALFLNDALRIPYEAEIDSMRLFWDPVVLSAFLLPPVLLAWRFLPRMQGPADRPPPGDTGNLQQSDDAGRPGEESLPGMPPLSGDMRLEAEAPTEGSDLEWQSESAGSELQREQHVRAARKFRVASVWGCLMAAVAVLLVTLGVVWDPVGKLKQGRVLVEEYHPDPEQVWEKTWTPMDTHWYGHMSGYNYSCIYQYLTHFYRMECQQDTPLTAGDLDGIDVLLIKVPTRPFAVAEVESIVQFVRRGGGLLLIGEHTNFRRSSTFMNPIARRFGFHFRTDNVYSMRGKIYEIPYDASLVPHPIVQHARTLNFATPCSIAAEPYSGRAVIRGLALKNLPANYHAWENYMPAPGDRAETRYGPFVQLWATRYGNGRVVAFTDSTVFSNFSAFEPDTAELMLGMVDWLNRRPPPIDPRPWLILAGGALLAAGVWLARPATGNWVLLVAAGLCGWAMAVVGARAVHAAFMPLPEERQEKTDLPEEVRQKTDVVIDQTVCRTPLPVSGFIAGGSDTYGIFERWILRLGYFTSRRDATRGERDVFGEELLVFLNPNHPFDEAFQQRLIDYVSGGGKVLIIESPLENRHAHETANGEDAGETTQPRPSVVNELLKPFDISIDHGRCLSGALSVPSGWPQVSVEDALAVQGGTPFASVEGVPVGVSRMYDKGVIVVVGFGNRFTDDSMGYSDHSEPDEAERQVFELQYRLIREIVESSPPGPLPPPAEANRAD